MTVRIKDPAKSLERIHGRIHEAEQFKAEHEASGNKGMAEVYRRRIRGLKASSTRISRMLNPDQFS